MMGIRCSHSSTHQLVGFVVEENEQRTVDICKPLRLCEVDNSLAGIALVIAAKNKLPSEDRPCKLQLPIQRAAVRSFSGP